jgi:hypothetical protein
MVGVVLTLILVLWLTMMLAKTRTCGSQSRIKSILVSLPLLRPRSSQTRGLTVLIARR